MPVPELKHGDILLWDNDQKSLYLFLEVGSSGTFVPVRIMHESFPVRFGTFHTNENQYKVDTYRKVDKVNFVCNIAHVLDVLAKTIEEKINSATKSV